MKKLNRSKQSCKSEVNSSLTLEQRRRDTISKQILDYKASKIEIKEKIKLFNILITKEKSKKAKIIIK